MFQNMVMSALHTAAEKNSTNFIGLKGLERKDGTAMYGFFIFFLMLYGNISVLEGKREKKTQQRKLLKHYKAFCFFLLKNCLPLLEFCIYLNGFISLVYQRIRRVSHH